MTPEQSGVGYKSVSKIISSIRGGLENMSKQFGFGSVKGLSALLLFAVVMTAVSPARAIPAFARKYGLPCSACHEAWPMLNNFGQTFKDNGYQLGNGRDAPIYQQPEYWPIAFRLTPQWHRDSNARAAVDQVPGNGSSGQVEASVSKSGFDTSSIDLLTAGTLSNNISFFVQSFIGTGSTFLTQAWVRFDNLAQSRWLNLKFGQFELDEPISQERVLTLNNTGGIYYNYFFTPPGDRNLNGIGNNQLGVELSGHSENDYTRYSIATFSQYPSQTFNVFANITQSFEVPKLGLQRVGAFGYLGEAPTYFQTSGGTVIKGAGLGNRSYYRAGVYGMWYVGKFDFETFYQHAQDNVFLGNSVPANQPAALPIGAAGPTWNGGFVEAHYLQSPRLVLIGRYELVRMSRQASPQFPSDAGNLDTWTAGYRWYPIMNPRAGLAWVQEFSRILNAGQAPLTGRNGINNSLLMGFDFDF
jgi:hypothetical protein